jgi:hypothetical protein
LDRAAGSRRNPAVDPVRVRAVRRRLGGHRRDDDVQPAPVVLTDRADDLPPERPGPLPRLDGGEPGVKIRGVPPGRWPRGKPHPRQVVHPRRGTAGRSGSGSRAPGGGDRGPRQLPGRGMRSVAAPPACRSSASRDNFLGPGELHAVRSIPPTTEWRLRGRRKVDGASTFRTDHFRFGTGRARAPRATPASLPIPVPGAVDSASAEGTGSAWRCGRRSHDRQGSALRRRPAR